MIKAQFTIRREFNIQEILTFSFNIMNNVEVKRAKALQNGKKHGRKGMSYLNWSQNGNPTHHMMQCDEKSNRPESRS